jgi:DNA repair protein RadC
MQGDSISRLLRASVPRQTAELVANTINAARDLTSWWPAERARVQAPADLAAIAQPLFGRSPQEQLHIAIVDGRNGLLDLRHVYTGTATGTSVRIGELLRPVLEAHGVGFAAVHNHPSGDPEPSDEDLRLTSELLAAARLLDIEFLDHLVIGHGRWVSIRSKQPSIWGGEPH